MATAQRLERLRARFDALGIDALLVTSPSNRRWISGFTGSAGVVLVGRDDALIATDSRYWEQAGRQSPGFRLVQVAGATTTVAPDVLEGTGGLRVGFEPAHLSVALHEEWQHAIERLPPHSRPDLVPAPRAIEDLRMVKEPEEVEALQRAVTLGDEALAHGLSVVRPGMTERELAWEIEVYARTHGASGMSFETIVAGGPWGAMPHARPREIALEEGQGVVIDMGVVVDGYCSDLTRTVFLGRPDDRFRAIYDIVLTAQEMATERAEAGMTGREVHEVAHEVIRQAGYGEAFGHGLGHGVGLDVHEDPRLSPFSGHVLQDGHVVTVEPGIYLPDWGGVRIEDQCVMEGGRLRPMTAAPKLDLELAR